MAATILGGSNVVVTLLIILALVILTALGDFIYHRLRYVRFRNSIQPGDRVQFKDRRVWKEGVVSFTIGHKFGITWKTVGNVNYQEILTKEKLYPCKKS